MRTILAQLKQYKKDSILTPLFTALEVIMEVMLPFITALIIDEGIQEGNMRKVYTYGGVMIVMAFISLISGAMAGKYAASASSGLACNLRKGVYDKVQDFSFSNIDKFSTAGLVTRMTTDVTNIQNAYQMCIRVAVRAPLMLVCSMVMSFMISPRLSMIFLGAILFLACILGIIMMAARKIFNVVFTKYDDLNAGVQENISDDGGPVPSAWLLPLLRRTQSLPDKPPAQCSPYSCRRLQNVPEDMASGISSYPCRFPPHKETQQRNSCAFPVNRAMSLTPHPPYLPSFSYLLMIISVSSAAQIRPLPMMLQPQMPVLDRNPVPRSAGRFFTTMRFCS